MLTATIQTILTAIACALLVVAWRSFRRDRTISLLVAAGILVRAIVGQSLFWISYLALPLGRSLQAGHGFWFYARDGILYFERAANMADQGIGAVLTLDPTGISPGFTNVLAVFGFLFGPVVSTALLLNLAAYVGTCAIVVKLAGEQKRVAVIAVAAISLSPASILWSTQPLKDVLFLFLFAAFVSVTASWISAWRAGEHAFLRAVALTLAMMLVLCGIAGIRWYFAVALLITSAPLLLLASLRTRMPLRAMATLAVMYGVVVFGAMRFAEPHVPPSIRELITAPNVATRSPHIVAAVFDGTRYAFDSLSGATHINAGASLSPSTDPRTARFVSGSVALLLPRPLARATGLLDVHGGRGFWLFADLDTIVFDVVLVFAAIALLRTPRLPKWSDPLLWLVIVVTALFAAAFAYCVGNFGALFRYRSMIFIGVVLVPVVAAWAEARATRATPIAQKV